jgi:YVTN family beta-propeller protein
VTELPQGTVTFLFTDIEGSTELLKRLGERYHDVLDAHARILREAASSHGGSEVDNQGDSFFFAFARANAALGAAVVAQRALAAHEWPDGAQVRVRMGLHTGEPSVGGERYVGLGVHRAARIGAAGHGGQVLLSNPTRELVEEELDGVVVRDIGFYKLKDIDRPEHLYQLDIGGLPSSFPPLKAAKIEPGRRLSRRPVVVGALAGVIAAAVAIPVFAFGGGSNEAGAAPDATASDSLAIVDPGSGRLLDNPDVGATPTAVAYGEGAYWVANADGGSVSRVDPSTNKVVQTITDVGSGPSGIAIGHGFVWVTNSLDGTVAKIDPGTNTVVDTITVGNGPVGIVYAKGAVWVANTADDTITRIDPSKHTTPKPLPIAATELAYGDGTLWATQRSAGRVVRIDPESGELAAAPIPVGNGPTGIAYGNGSAWVANSLDGTVSRISPTNTEAARIPTGDTPTAIAVDPRGAVWVANQYGGTLRRIDPDTNQPGKPIDVGNQPQGIVTAGSQLLVSIAARAGSAHRGGTLKIAMGLPLDSIDTAVAFSTTSWPFLRLTNDGLVAFDHSSGVAGDQPVPDLAVALPQPTEGGKTYTFRLRPNLRYSNGKPVVASDVRATFERYFRNGTVPVTFYDGIVGAAACKKDSKHCDLSKGIVTDDTSRTVTFHLAGPDPEFIYKLAVPTADVLPAGTPAKVPPTTPVPATGPYVISAYRPNRYVALVRNPRFHEWSQAAQPDGYPNRIEIRIEPKATTDDLFREVSAGRSDLVSTVWANPPSASQLEATMSEHASQVHSNPLPQTTALFLNTRVAPFNRLDVRRALNYAIDRAAYSQQFGGGSSLAVPTCQVVPPGLPGYRPYCPYTAGGTSSGKWIAPDLTKARALVAGSGTHGMKVKVWVDNYTEAVGSFAAKLLRSLGYRPSVKVIQNGKNIFYYAVVGDSRNKVQVGFWNWTADYPTASDFFLQLFTCESFHPKTPNNANYPEFCDPALDRQIKRALAQESANPQASAGLWQDIDRALADQAPLVPLNNARAVDVVSKRVGNYQYAGNGYGVSIDELWVK